MSASEPENKERKSEPEMDSRSRSAAEGPIKVVYINTQYVETDAVSFKSVVQMLTGKDSTVATDAREIRRFGEGAELVRERAEPSSGKFLARGNSLLMRDLSFKEIDRLLKALPPMDELHTVFAD
ncbi:hypothetical protein Nepgr_026320 [Nepenthes gracilis]|uniref:VQ domain-containing protein n=1 Tax=Nepenthes gracilis TaxID=150966 RepID=A0AAD3Y0A6_NEPGR|nr:hypothetical protein Nepgr_026320 [Nepenthes gracilis]